MLGGDGIQVFFQGMAHAGGGSVIVAPPDHHGAGGRVCRLDILPHNALNVFNGLDVANGVGVEVGHRKLGRLHHHMGVGVNEPRHQAIPRQVYHFGIWAFQCLEGGQAARSHNFAPFDRQGGMCQQK